MFVAVVKRLSNGRGIKACRNPFDTHLGSIPDNTTNRNASSYLQLWGKSITRFLNYGFVSSVVERNALCHVQKRSYQQPRVASGKKESSPDQESQAPPPFTVPQLKSRSGGSAMPISMVTAYDYPSARLANECGIEMLLVGDSLGMVVLGRDETSSVTMEEMLHHCKAVVKGSSSSMVVGDMPFGSYLDPRDAALNAVRLVKEAGVHAVKLEGGQEVCSQVKAITDAGITVIGHVGLTPQSAVALGGFKLQGKTQEQKQKILKDAVALQEAGASAIVLELIPVQLAKDITDALDIPTVGIGAGNVCSGQVLVWHDVLGLYHGRQPRFVKKYGDVASVARSALLTYRDEVRERSFPTIKHTFGKLRPASEQAVRASFDVETKSIDSFVVLGGGAVGSLFAAHVAGTGVPTLIVSRDAEHQQRINEHRLRLISMTDSEEKTINGIQCVASVEEAIHRLPKGNTIAVLMARKGDEGSELACREVVELQTHFSKEKVLSFTIQNGMGHLPLIDKYGLSDSVALGYTCMGAEREAGVVFERGTGETILMSGPSPLQHTIAHSLSKILDTAQVGVDLRICKSPAEVHKQLWQKLLINAAINAVTAVTSARNGAVATNSFLQDVALSIVDESLMVAKATGHEFNLQEIREKVMDVAKATACNTSSTLKDIQRGNATEINAINGYIAQCGKQQNVPTPLNSCFTNLVSFASLPLSEPLCSSPRVISSRKELTTARTFMRGSVGFVPTMGALHEGHLSLVRQAREKCDHVIVSIFVNPTQFAEGEDLDKYPRTLEKDLAMLANEGVDVVFTPSKKEIYPENETPVVISIPSARLTLEGSSRPHFFDGVALVCAKLFNMTQPDAVFFGEKDAIQCIVIRQLVRHLALPIDVEIVPTVRERNGLAMSSRNRYLSDSDREAASIIFSTLSLMKRIVTESDGSLDVRQVKQAAREKLMLQKSVSEIHYVSVADADTGLELEDDKLVQWYLKTHQADGPSLLLSVAVLINGTRLIDNIRL